MDCTVLSITITIQILNIFQVESQFENLKCFSYNFIWFHGIYCMRQLVDTWLGFSGKLFTLIIIITIKPT